MRMYTKAGRSRWPYVIGAAVVVVGVAGGIAYSAAQPGERTAVATSEPSASAPATPGRSGAGDGGGDVAPTGCLGGQDRTADMVLAAQKSAKHTSFGAVEVATSFYRFLWQYPYPSVADSGTVSTTVMADTATDVWKDIAASYVAAGNDATQGVVPAGTPFHTSTTNGLWRVTEDSTVDRVTVELAVGYVIDGALSPSKVAGIGLVMVWQNSAWHVESGTAVDQTKLAAGGQRYTGGC
ncbi:MULTISPECIES: hypothetical protein [unclassified Cryobacterium]|uniref:hypothetical protein n=1 Tax=unclassified Cryobacterium TaxID=2649013 RepID=UPI002AB41A72|nr:MULTISPECIES: hypothetical protein [unclassified Cryobacterium]MDY7530044.1 hypothetical protein [Cryobacterium sp. 10C2]MDY7555308.1 hypothetical protein [Cryobacterium sp. 10C3]MEB0290599.1 hypothetical protein [Cryobacterium sp. 10C2]